MRIRGVPLSALRRGIPEAGKHGERQFTIFKAPAVPFIQAERRAIEGELAQAERIRIPADDGTTFHQGPSLRYAR